jgi:hypothetical protein
MIDIKFKCDKAINKKLRSFNVDKRKLTLFLNYLANSLVPTRKYQSHEIMIKGINSQSSWYPWGEDELEVGLITSGCSTKQERREYFLSSIAHEFRHWVQAVLQKVPEKKIAYSAKDISEQNDNYLKHPCELECHEWERLMIKFDEMV